MPLSTDTVKTLVRAFVSSRLDYCNALLYDVSGGLIVQHTAARLVTGARCRDHITPILRQLHWLSVRQRVQFKVVVLVFQCIRQCTDVSVRRLSAHLRRQHAPTPLARHSDVCCLTVTVHKTPSATTAGRRPWNSLPSELPQCDSELRRLLKMHLLVGHGEL